MGLIRCPDFSIPSTKCHDWNSKSLWNSKNIEAISIHFSIRPAFQSLSGRSFFSFGPASKSCCFVNFETQHLHNFSMNSTLLEITIFRIARDFLALVRLSALYYLILWCFLTSRIWRFLIFRISVRFLCQISKSIPPSVTGRRIKPILTPP